MGHCVTQFATRVGVARKKGSRALRTFIFTLIALFLVFGFIIGDKAGAQSSGLDKLSPDLKELVVNKNQTTVKVVVQFNTTRLSKSLKDLLEKQTSITNRLKNLNQWMVQMRVPLLATIAGFPEVTYVSTDRETKQLGHLSLTTGANAIRQSTNAGGTASRLDGAGIGIAVLDSGIYKSHKSFLDASGNVRIVAKQDFTDEGTTNDRYGHGTHVAAIAAGNGRIASGAYTGIAPGANIINLRVLDSNGAGRASYVLAAVDWIMTNRATYNIRVVNMSLGMPAIDSYKKDPVCLAVRRMVDAGIVVVVAAGNNGKDSAGEKIYGQIHSPGNEPSAITVGATNTFGTDGRGDDVVTSYSSRGPTRSFTIDSTGVKRYDNLLKPDLVAPGNKLISAEGEVETAQGEIHNLLLEENPSLDAGVSADDSRMMMYLSGTSIAAPVVAGAAAILLQVNPKLTPNLVKAILMYTAQPLARFNTFEQGAGQINIEGAVRLARLVRTDLSASTPLGAPLLTAPAPTPQTTIAGQSFPWAQGINVG
jgi:serine protease AprX